MKNCFQFENQSVYEHGLSVFNYTSDLISALKNEKNNFHKLPEWFFFYKERILFSLLPLEIIRSYTIFHDISKPYCRIIDENGKQHFPNHAQISGEIWKKLTNDEQVSKLMSMDMLIHTMKAEDISDFIQHQEAITLLIVGLAECFSNARLFGGIENQSFKIKYKHLDRRGKQITKILFGGSNVID